MKNNHSDSIRYRRQFLLAEQLAVHHEIVYRYMLHMIKFWNIYLSVISHSIEVSYKLQTMDVSNQSLVEVAIRAVQPGNRGSIRGTARDNSLPHSVQRVKGVLLFEIKRPERERDYRSPCITKV